MEKYWIYGQEDLERWADSLLDKQLGRYCGNMPPKFSETPGVAKVKMSSEFEGLCN
jgi:hypothetical protein